MRSITAREAKNSFGQLIDWARQEPVTVQKHGRPFVVVMSVEEFERLRERDKLLAGRTHSASGTR